METSIHCNRNKKGRRAKISVGNLSRKTLYRKNVTFIARLFVYFTTTGRWLLPLLESERVELRTRASERANRARPKPGETWAGVPYPPDPTTKRHQRARAQLWPSISQVCGHGTWLGCVDEAGAARSTRSASSLEHWEEARIRLHHGHGRRHHTSKPWKPQANS